MAITDSILALLRNPQQSQQQIQPTQQNLTQPQGDPTQDQTQQPSWVEDLITNHSNDGGRIKRTPVGFDFQRAPFDPSSYYNQIGTMKDISRLATNVTETEAANHQASILAAQQASDRASASGALSGINPKFTSTGTDFSGNSGSKSYYLKGVKSDVARAAMQLGPMFGIKTIYGKGPGSVPGSDHPNGLATDFMISNTKNGKERGTNLANYVIKNAKSLNVKYVIWYHYIWYPGGRGHTAGWHKYSGPSPHTDHVHVSYNS